MIGCERRLGWPCCDVIEVELLAAGLLQRVRWPQGHETLVAQVAREMTRAGRVRPRRGRAGACSPPRMLLLAMRVLLGSMGWFDYVRWRTRSCEQQPTSNVGRGAGVQASARKVSGSCSRLAFRQWAWTKLNLSGTDVTD